MKKASYQSCVDGKENSADLDQTAVIGIGSTLFAQPCKPVRIFGVNHRSDI